MGPRWYQLPQARAGAPCSRVATHAPTAATPAIGRKTAAKAPGCEPVPAADVTA